MSNSTHKGSWSRVSNVRSYWDCPLWDKKDNMNVLHHPKKYLFLDDVRDPIAARLYPSCELLVTESKIPAWEWDIVRSYDEFTEYLVKNGIPDVVSFDNDLWDVQYELATNPTSEKLVKQFQMIGWQDFEIKTGAHCADYLVGMCKALNKPIPTYYIHTANSAARPIIKEILENAQI